MTPVGLQGEDRAAAPAVGVVLLVAIAVILGSVIGAYVFGLTRETTPEVPSVVVSFQYDEGADPDTVDSWGRKKGDAGADALLTITHDHGLRVPAEHLELVGAAGLSDGGFDPGAAELGDDGYYDAGDELRVWVAAEDSVLVVWRSPEGTKSAALGVWEGA